MNRYIMRKKLLVTAVAMGTGMTAGVANAIDFYLCTGVTTATMPGEPAPITMWGYAEDTDADLTNGCTGTVQSPGPLLTVPVGDPAVNIHLRNDLPVPTSFVVPGQVAIMTPEYFTDGQGRQRGTSLTHSTAPDAIGLYQWSDFKPGSHAYHSGTHMAVQVQMGLYGGMKKDEAANMAYPGVSYDQEAIIFYSEIDPALHAAVASGSYGTKTGPTSTINYQPMYFLVNGSLYEPGIPNLPPTPLAAAGVGQRTLLRFYNGGLRSIAPTLLGQHMKVVAEDGRLSPYAHEQYSLLMPAGKTHDAIFTATHEGIYPIYDRVLNLSNGAMAPGGLYTALRVGAAAAGIPIANTDSYLATEDTPLTIPAPGVLGNDTDPDGGTLTAFLASAVSVGTLSLNPGGDFTYTPPANYNGTATFSYAAGDGVLTSVPATVTISVAPVNDAPLAIDDNYNGTADTPLAIAPPGVLGNDADVDGDPLAAVLVAGPASGALSLNADGSFSYTPNAGFSGSESFTYVANDAVVDSNVATVTLTIAAVSNQAPVANDDNVIAHMNTSTVITVSANDTDADGTLIPSTVTISGTLKKGNTATVDAATGNIIYTPRRNFRGSDTFFYTVQDDQGAISNAARVTVTVLR